MPRSCRTLLVGVLLLQTGCRSFLDYMAEGERQRREREAGRTAQPTPTPSTHPSPEASQARRAPPTPDESLPLSLNLVQSQVYSVQVIIAG